MSFIERNQHSRLFYVGSIAWMLLVPLPGMLIMALAIALPVLQAAFSLWLACAVWSVILIVAMIAGLTGRLTFYISAVACVLSAIPTVVWVAFLIWILATA